MELTEFDIVVLIVMTFAVVSMSFVFPALGLADVDASENDLPTYTVTESRFQLAGEMPAFPNTPTEGTLWFNTTKDAAFSENSIWLEGSNTDNGVQMNLLENQTDSSNARVNLLHWQNGTLEDEDEVNITENKSTGVLSAGEYRVAVEKGEGHDPPDYLEVAWKVSEGGQAGGGFIGRIPVVGALFGAASDVAAVLAWAVTIFIWFSTSLVGGVLNALGIIFDVSSYFLGLVVWLITTYGSVVSSAPSWVAIFVALPGILLSFVLGKIVLIGISLLPAT